MASKANRVGVFLGLCAFRMLNAALIRTQFDPDEYWQTLEPAYCLTFTDDDSCFYTWEWTRRAASTSNITLVEKLLQGPVRSYLPILPTYALYRMAKVLGLDSPAVISKGPILLNAVLVTAPTDYCVWILGSRMATNVVVGWWALFCSVTSWFQAYTLVRTYSNSVETMLLTAGIVLVYEVSSKCESFS